MSKYDPLRAHLIRDGRARITMSFFEIEQVLGFSLPGSARHHRAFWSNNPDNSVITRAWREAGYRTAQVDLASGSLAFVSDARAGETEGANCMAEALAAFDSTPPEMTTAVRHPAFGCMQGTVTLPPDVDLTDPADPEWGRRAYGRA
jgi:hypothetical protein